MFDARTACFVRKQSHVVVSVIGIIAFAAEHRPRLEGAAAASERIATRNAALIGRRGIRLLTGGEGIRTLE